MKKRTKTWIFYPLIVMGLLLILANSCKKNDDNNNNPPSYTVTDKDGNVYHTITIGTQVWMLENLKTTKFNDGTPIPLVTDNTAWGNLTTSGYCWYNNDFASNKNTYGALYNWYTVNTGKLAPTGWHVPTDAEWSTLTNYLGGESIAGGKLKETGLTHWISPNAGATNESGFTALPGGFRDAGGNFDSMGEFALFWTSTKGTYGSLYRVLVTENGSVIPWDDDEGGGLSIRCIRD